jgi:uncharacterized protein
LTPAADLWRHSVTELLRRHGRRRRVRVAAPMDDLVTTDATVPHDRDVAADLTLESIADGSITATGTITVPWDGLCRRCLQPLAGVAVVEVQEVFQAGSVAGDTYPLAGDMIDLAPMTRDAALLALPIAPLCSPDCPGPHPEAYPVAVEVEAVAADDGPPPDPRWATLADLRLDD